jgi:hypothetical protein
MQTNDKIVRSLALGMLLLGGLTTAVAQGVPVGRAAAPAPLEGTWNVVVTPYDCATGTPITVAAFKARLGFHAGGTMTETNFNPGFQPGQRSPGLGSWERTGPNAYHALFEAYVFFASPRYARGFQRVDQTIEMQDTDHWTSSALVAFTDEAGNPGVSGCFNAVAVRQE